MRGCEGCLHGLEGDTQSTQGPHAPNVCAYIVNQSTNHVSFGQRYEPLGNPDIVWELSPPTDPTPEHLAAADEEEKNDRADEDSGEEESHRGVTTQRRVPAWQRPEAPTRRSVRGPPPFG